ncbi:AMP-binding protein [Sulfitobacter noctilucicola]|uniref:Acyl-CoA synthetase (AMP-forming)/AMP-acid ligase II n=1 Tax=Sulfitobacter noctilucicola TaxID=1342301 RepID=A0A7W6M9D5_9RHOB|nr:AMP-binding protein [Sulfitobacter noctilucicola]KIN64265.1 AMP-binding protein [Sulfitobacter noctilucicola]MBB4174567.1 acyl-CoA synthetase (AMP-forming)/AMP-acid ligase II [Sulfitobacter noctilucicola]
MTGIPLPSVYAVFAQTAARWPERPVFNVLPVTAEIYGIPPGETTYGEALERADTLAERFATAGYGAGMRVALLLENRPDFFVIWLALNKLGISVVPINPDLRAAELEYMIGHAEPALIIAIPARQEELRQAAKAANIALAVVGVEDTPPPPRSDAQVAEPLMGADREAAVLYTSGTTGQPKGCVLPNTYFLHAGDWYRDLGGIATLSEGGERMITPLPIFHMNAMACSFMGMVTVGGCLTALDRFHPSSWWDDVRAAKATCLHYLGVMPSMLMKAPPHEKDGTHQVRFGFGAGVDPKLQAEFETRFNLPLVEAWAMTETGVGAVISAQNPDRLVGLACLGTPDTAVETRIVDDSGQDANVDTPGELLVRRAGNDPKYGFFSHYYKNPTATAEAWDGGWFHTGDIVRRDAEGRFFFVDRKKNVIRRSGENIAAVEVESVLMRHPDITAAGVAPVPDALRGDEVFACLTVADPSEAKAREIANWALSQMAYYKVPGYIAFVDALPLTATQKIQRATLKAMAQDLLAKGRAFDLGHLKKRQVA